MMAIGTDRQTLLETAQTHGIPMYNLRPVVDGISTPIHNVWRRSNLANVLRRRNIATR